MKKYTLLMLIISATSLSAMNECESIKKESVEGRGKFFTDEEKRSTDFNTRCVVIHDQYQREKLLKSMQENDNDKVSTSSDGYYRTTERRGPITVVAPTDKLFPIPKPKL